MARDYSGGSPASTTNTTPNAAGSDRPSLKSGMSDAASTAAPSETKEVTASGGTKVGLVPTLAKPYTPPTTGQKITAGLKRAASQFAKADYGMAANARSQNLWGENARAFGL